MTTIGQKMSWILGRIQNEEILVTSFFLMVPNVSVEFAAGTLFRNAIAQLELQSQIRCEYINKGLDFHLNFNSKIEKENICAKIGQKCQSLVKDFVNSGSWSCTLVKVLKEKSTVIWVRKIDCEVVSIFEYVMQYKFKEMNFSYEIADGKQVFTLINPPNKEKVVITGDRRNNIVEVKGSPQHIAQIFNKITEEFNLPVEVKSK